MNTPNNEGRKQALITVEQEALLRAFAKAKKMKYGQLSLFVGGGKITGWELRETGRPDASKNNIEILKEIELVIDEEVLAI